MGHAHHFLSRLDRVDAQETELALSFYNDPKLLRAVIERARVPERAERVAVALSKDREGPHVIVTRDAQFVTCLGRGMKIGEVPVIPRAQLDAIAANEQELRRTIATIRNLEAHKSEYLRLMQQIYTMGDAVPRETIETLLATQMIAGVSYFQSFVTIAGDLDGDIRLAAKLRRNRLRSPEIDFVRTLWERIWAVQHLMILMSCDEIRDCASEDTPRAEMTRKVLGFGLVDTFAAFSSFSFHARGLWSVARLGKVCLPSLKRALSVLNHGAKRRAVFFALVGLGMRHARLRAEILKAISVRGNTPFEKIHAIEHQYASDMFATCESQVSQVNEIIQLAYEPMTPSLVARGLIDRPERQAIPENVCLALGVGGDADMDSPELSEQLSMMLPAIARGDAPSLYLPHSWLQHFSKPWQPAQTFDLIDRFKKMRPRPTVVRSEPKQGRNDSCSCNSGKKFKRCCGST
jgi:hypothetical protein